jgi:hypothetical protein
MLAGCGKLLSQFPAMLPGFLRLIVCEGIFQLEVNMKELFQVAFKGSGMAALSGGAIML